jgi:WD40 repeat protein
MMTRYIGANNFKEHVRSTMSTCGSFVFSGSEDGLVYVWDTETGNRGILFVKCIEMYCMSNIRHGSECNNQFFNKLYDFIWILKVFFLYCWGHLGEVWNKLLSFFSGDLVKVYNELGYTAAVSDIDFHPHDNIIAFCSFGQNHPLILYQFQHTGWLTI